MEGDRPLKKEKGLPWKSLKRNQESSSLKIEEIDKLGIKEDETGDELALISRNINRLMRRNQLTKNFWNKREGSKVEVDKS